MPDPSPRRRPPGSGDMPSEVRRRGPSAAAPQQAVAGTGATKGLTAEQTAARESKAHKILVRAVVGFSMLGGFYMVLRTGPLAVCGLVVLIQTMMFRELVNVKYKAQKEEQMPLFRTLQWAWFGLSMVWAYGSTLSYVSTNKSLHRWSSLVSLWGFSVLLVISILSLRKGMYKYQFKQYMWTMLTVLLVVGQLKAVVVNIAGGLFWFLLPASLVINNDTMAYVCGMSMGRKIIRYPFLELSPNKTWEGFIGGGILTVIFAWYWAAFLSNPSVGASVAPHGGWLICPVDPDNWSAGPTECQSNPGEEFLPTTFGTVAQSMWPLEGIVSLNLPSVIASVNCIPVQVHAVCLAMFASCVAPFGGFLASAIKRAHDIKDFDNLFPGHGGIVDRMDCQLLMALCTYVHCKSFVRPVFGVDYLAKAAAGLSIADRKLLIAKLLKLGADAAGP